MKKDKNNKPIDMLDLWERLELKLDIDDSAACYITRIEDIDKDALTVECPIRISGDLELSPGQNIEVVFNRPDASYGFTAIVAAIDSDRENMTTLKPVSEVKRSQKRRFVRIDIAGDIVFRILDSSADNKGAFSGDRKGELLNISAGGILITVDEPVKQNDILLLNFWMKDNQRLSNILGVVKRAEQSANSDNLESEHLVGVEFLSKESVPKYIPWNLAEILPPDTNFFNDALQELIVAFVYKQQVDLRTKQKANL
ncbi:MAG: PilZ domain-containing protein [candidate division Zixibacteria bacterium]|nr:PilZ domain-containing protein [candidate division Zixibacteria bacterium]